MTFVNESCYANALYSELCFAKRSATAASWSKHFATQNGLRPPRFLRGAYFAVHWSKHFATQNGLLSKFCYAKPPIQNFASQSGLRPPHHGHDFRKRKLLRNCAILHSQWFPKWNPSCHDFCFFKAKAALPPHCLVRSIDGIHSRRGERH